MRLGRPLAASGLVACALSCGGRHDITGVEIVATYGSATDHLVVFLAAPDPTSGALETSQNAGPAKTKIYARLDGSADSFDTALAATPGTAELLYEPGATEGSAIPYAIVLGMAGSAVVEVGTLEDLTMTSGEVRRYLVTLAPAAAIASAVPSGARGVELWTPATPAGSGGSAVLTPGDITHACVRVSPGAGEGSSDRAIVTSTDDPDCDGAAHECPMDDFVYDGTTALGPDLTCAGSLSLSNAGGTPFTACALGAPVCADVGGKLCGDDTTAAPLCGFPSLCAACTQIDQDVAECASEADLTQLTHIACDFVFHIELTSGNATLCDASEALPGSTPFRSPAFQRSGAIDSSSLPVTSALTANLQGNAVALSGLPSPAMVQGLLVTQPGSIGSGGSIGRGVAVPIQITVTQQDACPVPPQPPTCHLVGPNAGGPETTDHAFGLCIAPAN